MQWKKHNTADSPITDRSLSSRQEQECPLLNVIGASEFGVVLESERAFDIGSALTIGFHVDSRIQKGNNDRNSSFISAETVRTEVFWCGHQKMVLGLQVQILLIVLG